MPPVAGSYRLEGLAVPQSLDELHQLLAQVAVDHPDVNAEDLSMLETATIEIAGNVVEHGRPAGKVIYNFSLTVADDRLLGVLADSGEEMAEDPDRSAPLHTAESGRGLLLAQAVLDELTYARTEEQNYWTMVRVRRG